MGLLIKLAFRFIWFSKFSKYKMIENLPACMQGQTGRVFQLRVGSGSGIEKIFWVGSGWVPGICIKYQINWVLWGIEILIGYSPSISLISYTF